MANPNRRGFSLAEVTNMFMRDDNDVDANSSQLEDDEQSSDDGEMDILENQTQNEESSDESNEPEDQQAPSGTRNMKSKNGQEIWQYDPVQGGRGRQPMRNVMRNPSGPTRQALRHADSIQSCFELFLNQPLINLILEWTNKEGRLVFGEDKWEDADEIEIKCFIGLLILAGVYRGHNEAVVALWNEKDGRDIFRKSMARQRFTSLSRCLRFDDAASRRQRRNTDKLAPIREAFDMWVTTLQDWYMPYENVTVDEQLVTFRGRCPFKQYIPSKPGKYGIKIWVMCDSATHYVCNMQVYTGREENQPREVNQGQRVVLDMIRGLGNSGRNVTCDNFFTSLGLARELERKQLTLLGTIRANKVELPLELTQVRGRVPFSSIFAFQPSATLVSYCPKKGKVVLLLSTMHNSIEVEATEQAKPRMILDYNATKSGVDTVDQMARNYTVKRMTRRWPMVIFYNMIDISALNSYIIWLHANPEWNIRVRHKRRVFLVELGKALLQQNLERRAVLQRQPEPRRHVAEPSAAPKSSGKRGRCVICPRSKDLKHSVVCCKCGSFVCKDHLLCFNCQ